MRRLAEAFEEAGGEQPSGLLPHIGRGASPSVLVAPLLASARDRLREGVAALGPSPLGSPEEITALLLPPLIAGAHAMATRTVIVELHVARLGGELAGDTPQERYRAFLRRLADPHEALLLLCEYPVLARQLTVAAEQWTRTGLTLVRRLAADLPALAHTFASGASPASAPVSSAGTSSSGVARGG